MAMTAAERQKKRRQRIKEEGGVRRDGNLDPDEKRMLKEICADRRPGRTPYLESEVIGLLIRKNYVELQQQLAELKRSACLKCGDTPPIASCPCKGEHKCWVTLGYQKLAIKL